MSKLLKQLFGDAKQIKLSDTEKVFMKQELQAFMRKNPSTDVRTAGSARHQLWSMPERFKLTFLKPMPIFIALLILLGGSTSFAAEKALPGDALYPVKVNLNEQVRGFLTLDSESKANWEAILADRRLDEAEELAAQGELDTEARAHIEARFKAHADKVEARIKEFEAKDSDAAADVSSNFETSLKVHARILSDIGIARDGNTEPETNRLIIKVRSEEKDAAENKNESERNVSKGVQVQAAAEARMHAAENKIVEVEKFINNNKDRFDADAMARAKVRLDMAKSLAIQGKAKLDGKAYADAFIFFGKAHATAQEAKLLLEAKIRFERPKPKPTPSSDVSPSPSASPNPTATTNTSIQSQTNLQTTPIKADGRIKIRLDF